MTAQEIVALLKERFGDAILEAKTEGVLDPFVVVAPARVQDIAMFLRDDERLKFDSLMCLSGMDYTGGKLGVVYHLDSMAGKIESRGFPRLSLFGNRIGRSRFCGRFLRHPISRSGRDEFTDDHVLLQSQKRIVLSFNGRSGQHLDGVLEG